VGQLLSPADARRPTVHDLYAAEFVLDLWDLAHLATYSQEPLTIESWGRIRGVQDPNAIRSVLSRVRSVLRVFGIELETLEVARNAEDNQRDRVELRVNPRALRRLVEPDIELACALLDKHRERVNGHERRLDRIRPRSLIGAHAGAVVPRQLWLFSLEEADA
jgi:hypothetical protein